jgi:4'-phosphopantetheinyl transferase
MGCPPDDVQMITGEHGKPMLMDGDLRFNASRSGGRALYATSRTTEVGVDIEEIRSTVDVEGMAAMFFSPAERAALASLPPAARPAASFQCWTRKEAYVKGTATGLTVPINTIDVGVVGATKVSGWAVHQVDVAPGFAAAVAAQRYDGTVPIVQEIAERI